MLKNTVWGFLFLICLIFVGCGTPFRGLIISDVKEPGVVINESSFLIGPAVRHAAVYALEEGKGPGSKSGEASVKNVLGLFAFGDASVEGAAREAGISTIHTIDSKVFNFFGIYQEWTTIVTGE